jgi:hypothetical protein
MSGPPRFWRPTFHVEVRTTVQVRETFRASTISPRTFGHAAQAVLKYWQLKASADDSGDNLLPIAYLGATQSTSTFRTKNRPGQQRKLHALKCHAAKPLSNIEASLSLPLSIRRELGFLSCWR